MKQIDSREGARRQHRALSLFAVIQCWIRNLDGVVFERPYLERLIGLERFRETRIEWLQTDLKAFFPYQKAYPARRNASPFQSLLVSRLALDGYLQPGPMLRKDGAFRIKPRGPKIDFFRMWSQPNGNEIESSFEGVIPFFADSANYDERFLSSCLSLLAQGQISPHNLPPLEHVGSKSA